MNLPFEPRDYCFSFVPATFIKAVKNDVDLLVLIAAFERRLKETSGRALA